MKTLKLSILSIIILISFSLNANSKIKISNEFKISKTELLNKIKGGWAGQVIGCTYGGPTEFKWNGTMIGDHVPIPWDDSRMLWYYENAPGLYDDVYMDLTFVDVFEKYGLDAPDSLHALAWKQGIDKVEDMNFRYTDMSLNKVYETGFRHAVEMIKRNKGKEKGDMLTIQYQKPQTVPLEIAFEGLFPTERKGLKDPLSQKNPEISFEMEGCGFVVTGQAAKAGQLPDITLEVDVFVDGQLYETVKMPANSRIRRLDVAWNYDLKEGPHTITLKAKNIPEGYRIQIDDVLLYSTVEPGAHVHFN